MANDKELFEAIDARQQSIDIPQLHGNVRILTLPYEQVPRELNKLCDSSATKLYSKNGRLQYIDVFVHIYVARLFNNPRLSQVGKDPAPEKGPDSECVRFSGRSRGCSAAQL